MCTRPLADSLQPVRLSGLKGPLFLPPLLLPAAGSQSSPRNHLGNPAGQLPSKSLDASRVQHSSKKGDQFGIVIFLQLLPSPPGLVLLLNLGPGHHCHSVMDALASLDKTTPRIGSTWARRRVTGPLSVSKNLMSAAFSPSVFGILLGERGFSYERQRQLTALYTYRKEYEYFERATETSTIGVP